MTNGFLSFENDILYELSKVIFSTLELDELLKIIVNSTTKILSADESSIMLFDSEKKLYIAASCGLDEEIQRQTRLAIGERIAGFVARDKKPLLLIDGLKNDIRFRDVETRKEIKSSLVIPLAGKTGLLGVLNVNRIIKDEHFTENDLKKANIFIDIAVLSIENAMLFEEVQKKQVQLIQSEKMSSLGIMAGGIAHELNNPLTTILGNAQLMLDEIPKNNTWYETMKEIESSAQRCSRIISDLLLFSRQQNYEFQLADIHWVIEQTLLLCSRQIVLEKIDIVKKYAQDLPKIEVSIPHIQQVFLNIILNAWHAMPDGGTLTITTRKSVNGKREMVDEKTKQPSTVYPLPSTDSPDFIEISFNDTGIGIPEENLNKIFDPFFTTSKSGTGLGLSVSYDIVNKHNGRILVEEGDDNKGTKFTVQLPIK